MPKRTDLRKILVLGSGPIVIGQACEFDYSGAQGCKALREEGYEVVLVNSNPATIMTDPELADRTYVEPLVPEVVAAILARERPDALLPTLGGQTALNLAMTLAETGVLAAHGVALIGASAEVIARAEDRALFKDTMAAIGLDLPASGTVTSLDEAERLLAELGLPLVIRPSFTLGGTGGGIATTAEAYRDLVAQGLTASPIGQILVEEGLVGWKEFELEVVRDGRDNVVIVCAIENIDPLGVHTGDSWTVAPALTLSDQDYQRMRDAAIAAIRAIGVDTGGANVQFALDPKTGRMVVIEINPRVSRSSALASKATGFPIAKIAAKLAIGYHLDELINDITGTTACFEPTIDYVVTKAPRFDFEKFGDTVGRLGTAMRAVGEVMAIGRTFKESLQKAVLSLEIGATGLLHGPADDLEARLAEPRADRIFAIAHALAAGQDVAALAHKTGVDPFFLGQMSEILAAERALAALAPAFAAETPEAVEAVREAKRLGFGDPRLAALLGTDETRLRAWRLRHGIRPTFKHVDTCAAEFAAETPYVYSCYEDEDEATPSEARKVVVLGGGPNRIGQGIEFDYCCVHAAQALREAGYEAQIINCNPETVSTDFDTSDRLFFEPLTLEHVLNVVEHERPLGVILSFGGQTPLRLAEGLEAAGVPILGTPGAQIRLAEDRGEFGEVLAAAGLAAPPFGTATTAGEALAIAGRLGYPVLLRPSFVLGGRAMAIARDEAALLGFLGPAFAASAGGAVLIDRFLGDAKEIDIDAIADGRTCRVIGVMEHLEPAGVHSGDSTCSLPPHSLAPAMVARLEAMAATLAAALGINGLLNLQVAIQGDVPYVLEANPRASRTVPFVSKATGTPWARIATRVMLGEPLAGMALPEAPTGLWAVKAPVFPFDRFTAARAVLGPEMRSTGEAMGLGSSFAEAFAKGMLGAGRWPAPGTAILLLDAPAGPLAGVADALAGLGFRVEPAPAEPAAALRAGAYALILEAPCPIGEAGPWEPLRRLAADLHVPWIDTLDLAHAYVAALASRQGQAGWQVLSLQAIAPRREEVLS